MSEVTVYVVRAVSMFAPNSQSARLAGSESKMERVVLAADYDRIVAEAEARGWNAAVEAAIEAVDDVYPVSDQWGHHTLPHIDRRQARTAIAALRKAGVEG